MFGALEILSFKALLAYTRGELGCAALPWKGWREDYWMETCMGKLGVDPLDDFDLLSDDRCIHAPCTDVSKVAFHAFKDHVSYMNCWANTIEADNRSSQLR